MDQIIKILRGNAHSGILLLWILGLLGAVFGVLIHFLDWSIIAVDKQKNLVTRGIDTDFGALALAILAVYCIFLGIRSVFTIFWAMLFLAYTLEQVIGMHLLRYMPLESTKLLPPLYLYLPTVTGLMLVGSFSPILEKISRNKS
jgi:hypothetical protein